MAEGSRPRGRPFKIIDERPVAGVAGLKAIGLKWREIASLIGVAESTLGQGDQVTD